MSESGSTSDASDEAAVADRLHSAAIHLLRRLRREDAALGVSAARLSALSVIVFGGPLTLGELAAAEGVRPPTMTRIVSALEADGLVTRRKDARDQRVRRIQATERGEAVMRHGRGRRTARLADVLATLDAADLATVARATSILERLVEELNAPKPVIPSAARNLGHPTQSVGARDSSLRSE